MKRIVFIFLSKMFLNLSISEIRLKVKIVLQKKFLNAFQRLRLNYVEVIFTSGYYTNKVCKYGNKDVFKKYIEIQGKEIKNIKKHKK